MNTPKVWFWLRKQTKKERLPIYFRIYLNNTDTNGGHSTKIKVSEKEWLQDKQQISANFPKAKTYNAILFEIENNLMKFWQSLDADRQNITAMEFYELYMESLCPKIIPTALQVYSEWIGVIEKRVIAKKITDATLTAWNTAYNNFKKYLKSISKENLKINKINQTDFESLEMFYLNELNFENNYCSKQLAMIKTVLKYAKQKCYIKSNPFENLTKKKVKKEIRYLENSELQKFENAKFENATLEKVNDFFLFQCYTGLDYVDMIELNESYFYADDKGLWIMKQRHKTINCDSPFMACIPLFINPKSLEILAKYKTPENLPKMTNQRLNFYLKCICEILQIKKPISSKYSRRTFAMRMLNEFGFSKESVAVMLGDRDLDIVETHYARANKTRIESELKKLGL